MFFDIGPFISLLLTPDLTNLNAVLKQSSMKLLERFVIFVALNFKL